jgi:ethanolamine utilization protein EutQ (cupin superfamily)
MDENTKNATPAEETPEEEEVVEANEDEVRSYIINELGIDEDDEELISKLVERELSQKQKLSEAIRQKINWREKAKQGPEPKPTNQQDVKSEILSILEEERLEDMELPEGLKEEVRKISKLNNISVKKAAQDPYVLYKKQELEAAAKVQDATISRTNKGKSVKFDPANPPQVDMSTEEGRATWDEYKEFLKNQ